MRSSGVAWSLFLAVLAGTPPAAAATVQDQAAFEKILRDRTEQADVLAAARRSAVMTHEPCPSAKLSLTGQALLYVPVERDASGAISKGIWAQGVRAEGCGVNRMLNVLAIVKAPKTLETLPLLPGSTRADPQLQRDAVQYAWIAAQVTAANCKDAYVADTRFLDREATPIEGGKSPPWREEWSVAACGRKLTVPMRFIPDATGTKIIATGEKAPQPPQGSR